MNYYLLTAGIFATLATIGHFTIGSKEFLSPILNSNIEQIPKKVMHSIFHYMSVILTLTTIILLAMSFGNNLIFDNSNDIVKFIGYTYAGFAISQFFIALFSSIEKGIFKLFQWIFWTLIAFFSLASIY